MEADESGRGGEQASEPEEAGQSPPTPSTESSFSAPTSSAIDVGTANGHSRRIVIGIVAAAVVVAAVIVGFVLFGSSVADAFITGHGTATITWKPAPAVGGRNGIDNVAQPFSGTVGGETVTGIAKTSIAPSSVGSILHPPTQGSLVSIFRWKGEFGGKSYDLGIFVRFPVSASPVNQSPVNQPPHATQLTVKGTYGGESVNAVVTAPDSKQAAGQADFHGTVGSWKVSGVISPTTGNSNEQKVVVSYSLSK